MDNKQQANIIGKITNIRGGGFVDIEPQSQFKGVDLAEIKNVPMCRLGNSESYLEFPMKVGDFVPVMIITDDISGFLSRGDKEQQSNKRGHINNAVALPFFIPTLANGGYEIPSVITQVGDEQIKGNTDKTGNIELKGNTVATGDLSLSGKSTASDHLSGGISGKNHKHTGVVQGNDISGGAI